MNCEELIAAYLAGLKEGFRCKVLPNGRICVLTPYLYPDHDNIEVFARPKGGTVVVSDLGETLRYLDTVGMDICNTPNYLYSAKRIANGFGVILERGVLQKDGPISAAGALMLDVILACQAVASLVYGNRTYEPAKFEDEVADFLEINNIHPERNVSITGTSGSKYKVSFRVPAAGGPAWVEALSPKSNAGTVAKTDKCFRMWSDINGQLPPGKKVSLLNDEDLRFREEDLTVLARVSRVFRWTEKQVFLAAVLTGNSAPNVEPRK